MCHMCHLLHFLLQLKAGTMVQRLPWGKIWNELSKDVFYQHDSVMQELIKEAINKIDLTVVYLLDYLPIYKISPSKESPENKTKILIHIDPEPIKSMDFDNKYHVINCHFKLLHLWCMDGLDTYYEGDKEEIRKSKTSATMYSFKSSSTSALEIDCDLFKDFLRNRKLPLPHKIFSDEHDNTNIIMKILDQRSISLKKGFNLANIKKIVTMQSISLQHSKEFAKPYTFKLKGSIYYITFLDESCEIPQSMGLDYIHHLIEISKRLSALYLYYAVNPPPFNDGDNADLIKELLIRKDFHIHNGDYYSNKISLNQREIDAAKKELEDLEKERGMLLEGGVESDFESFENEINKNEVEINELKKILRSPYNQIKGGQFKKAYGAVSVAIKRAIESIPKDYPNLIEHLDISIKKGYNFCYRPTPYITWLT